MEGLVGLLPILAILLLFWLLLIRPQARRAREQQRLQSSVEVGDEVMLASGLFGRVVALHEDRVDIEIATGVVVGVLRAAIGRVLRDDEPGAIDPTDQSEQTDGLEQLDQLDQTDHTHHTDPAEESSLLRKRPTSGPEEN
ncbi:preprotein translocase subunit YajC [Nocardioides marinquilinus]|uniref:preprotein translocase subunit YajC n=1 Tax=Nocardioides marinquilinus TaxID=1210400 RepID=UPI0031F14205